LAFIPAAFLGILALLLGLVGGAWIVEDRSWPSEWGQVELRTYGIVMVVVAAVLFFIAVSMIRVLERRKPMDGATKNPRHNRT